MPSSWAARFIRARFAEIGREIPEARHKPDVSRWSDNCLTIAWLGHATLLINFFGVRILTDPALYARIGVNAWIGSIGPQRLTRCALTPGDLPEIDLLLVSHAHFDHLDTRSLGSLRGRPVAVMAPKTSDLLPRKRYSAVTELRWNETRHFKTPKGGISIRAIEVKHWGARLRRDRYRGYNGYIIEREGRKLLFAGDTAETPLFSGYRAHGPFEAAIMPIGAYDPWVRNHCTPEQAVDMANDCGAHLVIPVHHQTFCLSNEPVNEPIERATEALRREPERLAIREIGETVVIPA